MKALKLGLVVAVGMLVVFGEVAAMAGEDGPPAKGGRPGGPRAGGRVRPEGGRPGGPQAPFGLELPVLKAEMERNREAMRTLMQGQMQGELREQIREKIQNGAKREEIAAFVKEKAAGKAQAMAQKMAAELVQHHTNLAKIFEQPAVAEALAKKIVERVTRMAGERGRGDGPKGERPERRGPRPPKPEGGAGAPENF